MADRLEPENPYGRLRDQGTVTDSGRAVFFELRVPGRGCLPQNLCNALRAAGTEVWFDLSELRGGDTWDALIRRQIKGSTLLCQ